MRPEISRFWEDRAPVGTTATVVNAKHGNSEDFLILSYERDFLLIAHYDETSRLHELLALKYEDIAMVMCTQSVDEEFLFEVKHVPYADFAEGMPCDNSNWETIWGWMISTMDAEYPTHEFLPEKFRHRGLACKRKQTDLSTHGFVWDVEPHPIFKGFAEGSNGSDPFR